VDPGSRQRKCDKPSGAFSSEVDARFASRKCDKPSRAFSSEVDAGSHQENATNQKSSIGAQKKEASLAAGLLRETSIHAY
jgi:hypothetical protein